MPRARRLAAAAPPVACPLGRRRRGAGAPLAAARARGRRRRINLAAGEYRSDGAGVPCGDGPGVPGARAFTRKLPERSPGVPDCRAAGARKPPQ
eukprot:1098096-Prorocentrum_minimum.AAC.1